MADLVQRLQVAFTTSDASKTITAGVDYVAPTAGYGFARIVAAGQIGDGNPDEFNGSIVRNCFNISNPANIGTSLNIVRNQANGAVNVQVEIHDFSSLAGTANEIVVRGVRTISFAQGDETKDSTQVTGIVDDADVVPLLTGVIVTLTFFDRAGSEQRNVSLQWVGGATDVVRATRGAGGDTAASEITLSVAVLEFTGSNWTVQRIAHTFVAADTDETEAMSSVGDIANAVILQAQTETNGQDTGAAPAGVRAWLSSATQVTFRAEALASGKTAVAWVISNPNMSAQHVSGSRLNDVGTSPETWTESITAVGAMTEASVVGECCTTSAGTDQHYAQMGFRLTAVDTVTLSRGSNHERRDYRFSVVEWPSAGGTPVSQTIGATAEHLEAVEKTAAIPSEHRGSGVQRLLAGLAEHLSVVSQLEQAATEHLLTEAFPWTMLAEHLAGPAQTELGHAEHTGRVSQVEVGDTEHLEAVEQSETISAEHEAAFGLVQQQLAAAAEHLAAVVDSIVVATEHVETIEQARQLATEHALEFATARGISAEHVRSVQTSAVMLTEHLAAVVATLTSSGEHEEAPFTVVVILPPHIVNQPRQFNWIVDE